MKPPRPNVYGSAGKSASTKSRTDQSWKAGSAGEQSTARQLDSLAAQDPHLFVFHDVFLPGVKANIDHLLVRGNSLAILDTKQVKPGLYWTLNGRTRRGLSIAAPKVTVTVPTARGVRKYIGSHLDKQGVQMLMNKLSGAVGPGHPIFATFVMRSNSGRVNCRWMRLRGGVDSIPASHLSKWVHDTLGTGKVVDNPQLIARARKWTSRG